MYVIQSYTYGTEFTKMHFTGTVTTSVDNNTNNTGGTPGIDHPGGPKGMGTPTTPQRPLSQHGSPTSTSPANSTLVTVNT